MENKYLNFYKDCIDVWGKDAQIKMCIEEMSELTKELCKNYREKFQDTPEQIDHICEEIADVQNMVDQMQYIFGIDKVNEYREKKVQRTKQILDDEKRRKNNG